MAGLNAGDVPSSQVVSEPRVKLVESSGFSDAEPFHLEVAEESLHDSVVEAHAFTRHRLGELGLTHCVQTEVVTVLNPGWSTQVVSRQR